MEKPFLQIGGVLPDIQNGIFFFKEHRSLYVSRLNRCVS